MNSGLMDSENIIRKILEKTPFGLSASEISSRADVHEKTAIKLLEKMTLEKKVKRTRAGCRIFYKGIKYTVLLLILVSFITMERRMDGEEPWVLHNLFLQHG